VPSFAAGLVLPCTPNKRLTSASGNLTQMSFAFIWSVSVVIARVKVATVLQSAVTNYVSAGA
jgi:hypothetical protein